MSDYRGHVAAGAAFYGILAFVLVVAVPWMTGRERLVLAQTWWAVPAQLVVAVLAALWPDVDIASHGRKLFYWLFLLLDVYLMLTGAWRAAAFVGVIAILPGLGPHRGWTHRLWAALIVPAPIVVVPLFMGSGGSLSARPNYATLDLAMPYYLAAVAGYLSHLAADGLLGSVVGRVLRVLLWPVRLLGYGGKQDHGRS